MANIQRNLWDVNSQDSNSTLKFMPGVRALTAGQIKVFWPLSTDGLHYRDGTPVVEYRVLLSNGHDVTCATLGAFTDASGIKLTVGDFTARSGNLDERLVTISDSDGTVGIVELSVIVNAPVDNSFEGLNARVRALEDAGTSPGSQGVAVPDASGTTVASANATINALLQSLRDAGVIAS